MKFNLKDKSPEEVSKILADAWLNIYVDTDTIFNPITEYPREWEDNLHMYYLYLMSQPEYFSFFCREILNLELFPFQCVIQSELWKRKFPMLIGSRGLSKTWSLGLYCLLRAVFLPGRKIVIAGAGFRQSKLVFDVIVNIWNNAPLLRDFLGNASSNGPKFNTDNCKFTLNDSTIIAIPVGTGDRIRGLRAHDLISDEFASHSEEIFEHVLAGFANVSSDPISKGKQAASQHLASILKLDHLLDPIDETRNIGNQIILSGTAHYYFNHFFKYWKRWKAFIESQGNPDKLKEFFPNGPDAAFNWRDYSVMRIPVECLPPGFMDDGQIARSRATLHSGLFNMEFGSIFSEDSQGFFKATLINSCVADHKNLIEKDDSGPIIFDSQISGSKDKEYIFAIDPAADQDNFAIVVLELHKNHRRVVYCWTTNTKDFQNKRKNGEVSDTDYFSFCARKIRDLMVKFPTKNIAIDAGGGGKTIYEALHDKDKLQPGEQMIWEVYDNEKEKDCDGEEGLHIVHIIQFAKEEFTSGANHGMKKDFEDKILLFPQYDISRISLLTDLSEDDSIKEQFKELIEVEDTILEIEELKKELTQIVVTSTASGRERFDTPEIKLSGSEKGRLKKDRYSALLMANYVARNLTDPILYEPVAGGFSASMKPGSGKDFAGPSWMTSALNNLYD